MCGIIGVVGTSDATAILLDGLRRLEYRGYDSAGIATVSDGVLSVRRASGRIANLAARVAERPINGHAGIGHTRWATHGAPIERNAHPHATPFLAVVHNGIIENYKDLRAELEAQGVVFQSDTDTEVIGQYASRMIEHGIEPYRAIRATLNRLRGTYAVAFVLRGEDNLMYAARKGSPLVVGYGDGGEFYIGSDPIALAPMTSLVTYLQDGDVAKLSTECVTIFDDAGHIVDRGTHRTSVDSEAVNCGDYPHFMMKEICEQPHALTQTLSAYLDPETGKIALPEMPFDLADIDRITIVACGTAFYAGLAARYAFESIARVHVEVEVASEYRYRDIVPTKNGLVICVSQSGETHDTLAALRFARSCGNKVVSVVNVVESSIARESDAILPTLAGPEIGVASTKAYTTQLLVLACLVLATARARGSISAEEEQEHLQSLLAAPRLISEAIAGNQHIDTIAREILAPAKDALYLGRGPSCVTAMEGALKLKEISYIHAEGYAAGEMKHGPIALIDDETPVVAIAPSDRLFDKTASNLHEVHARGGRIIVVSDAEGVEHLRDVAIAAIVLPTTTRLNSAIVYAAAVQLLAYYTAVALNLDVDKPRNLAKSVTVE